MHAEIDLAYTAGIIDGEGCIAVEKLTDSQSRFGHQFRASVRVGNSKRELTTYLKNTFGGYEYKSKRKPPEKDSWVWKLGDKKNIQEFLQEILLYLKIKRKQADLVLESFKYRNGSGNRRTEEEEKMLSDLYKKSRELNGGKSRSR